MSTIILNPKELRLFQELAKSSKELWSCVVDHGNLLVTATTEFLRRFGYLD